MINLVIVEDSIDAREGFKYLLKLEKDFRVLKTCESAEELISDKEVLRLTNVVLMDIELPGINGIKATRMIKAEYPDIDILMLTIFEEHDKIVKAVQAGASGYILKNSAPGDLVNQIRSLSNGGSPISPGAARKLLDELRQKEQRNKTPDDYNLTPREIDIFKAIVEGYTYKEMAEELNIASSTAKKHILHIYRKLNVSSKVEFIKKVIDENLTDYI
ncbi:MAG: response regulator transcription factor [Spirochaetales bacterium]|nr:response regulator transcription factor [Spirochaetales bacterium]